jgi:hypothetical protein
MAMDGGVQPGQRVGIQQLMPLAFTQRKPGTSELTTAQTSFLPVRLPEQTCLEPTLDQVPVRTPATRRISLAMPRLLVDLRFIAASIVLQIRSSEPTQVDTVTLGGSIPFLAFAQGLRGGLPSLLQHGYLYWVCSSCRIRDMGHFNFGQRRNIVILFWQRGNSDSGQWKFLH